MKDAQMRGDERHVIGAVGFTFIAFLISSCGTLPPTRSIACNAAPPTEIVTSAEGLSRAKFSVLTYNIEGLGFPARSSRSAKLKRIGGALASMNKAGIAPDVVLFQEMFSASSKRAVRDSGYASIVTGPSRATQADPPRQDLLPGRSKIRRGEVGLRFLGSGLAIASRYAVISTHARAFGNRACAGFDCLANKGVMLARVLVPGVPMPIDIYNTHMNARRASKTPEYRNRAAHELQALSISDFIESTHNDSAPLILGGDFNMRHSEARWEGFTRYQSLKLVHRVCAQPSSSCRVNLSWDNDAPWMDTQDLQFFWPGINISMRPIEVEALFDGSPGMPKLSDHDGLLVTYEMSWPTGTARMPCKH